MLTPEGPDQRSQIQRPAAHSRNVKIEEVLPTVNQNDDELDAAPGAFLVTLDPTVRYVRDRGCRRKASMSSSTTGLGARGPGGCRGNFGA